MYGFTRSIGKGLLALLGMAMLGGCYGLFPFTSDVEIVARGVYGPHKVRLGTPLDLKALLTTGGCDGTPRVVASVDEGNRTVQIKGVKKRSTGTPAERAEP